MQKSYKCPQCGKDVLYITNPCPNCKLRLDWTHKPPIPYVPPPGEQQQPVVQTVEAATSQNQKTIEPSNITRVDLRKAECPYCHGQLKKIPGSKTKCPHCGKYMRVKTRPSDRSRVVVTEEESERIDEEWAVVSGIYDGFIADKDKIEKEREILKKKFGKEPLENDVKWGILNRDLLEEAQHGDWGLYRCTRFDMAEMLRKEMKLEQALQTYLEVAYIDLNGPNNTGGNNDPTLLKEFPPFDPHQSNLLAPGVIALISQITKYLKFDNDKVKSIFMEHNSRIEKNLRLPLSAENAWPSLAKYI